jgi:hypothetical protein
MASTALGPQSPNFSTTRPPTNALASAVDTWFKDCSAAGAKDGTVIDASFLNVLVAQLRTAVTSAGVTLDDTDDTMLWQAIQAPSAGLLATLTASTGLTRVGDDFRMDLGAQSNGALSYTQIDPVADTVPIHDDSGNVIAEATVYNMIRAALTNSRGVTFNGVTGSIEFDAPNHYTQATAPTATSFSDTWYDTANDILLQWTSNGTDSFWVQIS